MQDDRGNATSGSRHASRPASRAFEGSESSESHATLHHELASLGDLRSGTNRQGISSLQSINSPVPQTYASAMGASLSRNNTPDPQLVGRSPSPRIPALGGARVSSMDRRNVNVPNLYDEVSPEMVGSADLVASLSGLSLSMDNMVDERRHPKPLMADEVDVHHNLLHRKHPMKQHPYLNENLKGPSTPTLNSGGNSPSQYLNIPSPTSSLSNYGLSGYPASPLMLGNQMSGGNIPPLVEHVNTGPAIGISGLENITRLGTHTSEDALQMALMDPSYLQYLRSNGYSAAALSDPRMNRESLPNSHEDFLALQKAYVEALFQRSQYGLGFGKSSALNNGFHGNSAFGPGFAYHGNSMGGPVFPNSGVGSGGVGHVEQMMHFPSSLRTVSGNFMGPWPSELGCNLEDGFAASLLDEFKGNKTRCFELVEIVGHVVEFRYNFISSYCSL